MYSHPENDNAYDDYDDYDDDKDPHQWDADWKIDLLLMTAGFDPKRIPIDRRKIALEISELWKDGIRRHEEIEETLGHHEGDIRRAIKELHRARR